MTPPITKPRWGKQVSIRVYADVLSAAHDGTKLVVSSSAFRDVKVLDVAAKKPVEFPAEVFGYAKGCALLHDGRLVRVGDGGTDASGVTHPGNIAVFDASGARVAQYEAQALDELRGLAVSPDGQWVAASVGFGRAVAFLWSVEELLASKKPRHTFDLGKSTQAAAVAFAPSGKGLYRIHEGTLSLLGVDGTVATLKQNLRGSGEALTAERLKAQGDALLVNGNLVLSAKGTQRLALDAHLAEASCLADEGETLLTAAGSLATRYGKHEANYATPHAGMRDGFVGAWVVKGKSALLGYTPRRKAAARAIACGQHRWVAVGRDSAADLFDWDEVRTPR